MIDVEILEELVMGWAQENHSSAYDMTLAVQTEPRTYRRYLQRLVEIRWEREPEWRYAVPLRVLEDTSIVATFRHGSSEFECSGRRVEGPRRMSWEAMALIAEGATPDGPKVKLLESALRTLDLWVDPPEGDELPPTPEEPMKPLCVKCNEKDCVNGTYHCAECAKENKPNVVQEKLL